MILFTLILLASSSVPVLAAPEPQTSSLQAFVGHESVRLPDAQDVQEGNEAAEAEEAERQRWLQSPEAVRQRKESRNAFAGLGATEAKELLLTVFAEQLVALNNDPARWISEASILKQLDPTAATVSRDGQKLLLDADIPLRAPDEHGESRKLDLGLEEKAGAFEPANSLSELRIPDVAGKPISIGSEGLAVSGIDAGSDRSAQPLGEMNLIYPEALTDTDRLVSPTATGVEIFDLLRSADSPETVRFDLDLPPGAELRSDGYGGAVITRGDERLASIPFPHATDAQGTVVPVELEVQGGTISLHIAHREADLAYPILLDPSILNDWYNYSWANGHNYQVLTNGTWNATGNTGWIQTGTSCIVSCFWSSGRGLYIGMQSGNHSPNNYSQWIFTSRNSSSYIAGAWLNPFKRDDHNCGGYNQPHDYAGMWHNGAWNAGPVHNQAKIYGYTTFGGWGTALVIGMGTGGGVNIPCRRDLAVGGTAIWEDDWERPSISATNSDKWMDSSPVRLNVSATDSGLGVKWFEAEATDSSGATRYWETEHPCSGLVNSRCPNSWDLGSGSQPMLNYDPSVLPEGIRDVTVTAYDVTEKPSFSQAKMTVRIDHTAPTIALSGSLTQQASLGTELANYKLKIEAKDGEAGSSDPAKARSGVASLIVESDGEVIDSYAPGCATQSCAINEELELRASLLPPGEHSLLVKATDALGHTATKQLDFTTEDSHEPELEVSGMPAEEPGMPWGASFQDDFGSAGSGDGQFSHPADAAVDHDGNLWVLDRWNQRVQKFNWKGEYLSQFGSYGSGNGQFNGPSAIDTDLEGNVWVTDSGNHRVQKFGPQGEYLSQFGAHGSAGGQFDGPAGIAVGPGGWRVYVNDRGNHRIALFNKNGAFLGSGGSYGWEDAQFDEPTGIAIGGPWGEHAFTVLVVDSGNNRVQRFAPYGEFLGKFGAFGTGDGQFDSPGSVNVDTAGNVWIGDRTNGRVQGFSKDGEYLTQFGVPGVGPGQFDFVYPMGIAGNPNGSLWVTDAGNNRVQRWTIPKSTVSGYLEPISAAATDSGGYGVTSLKVTLTDWAQNTEVLGEATQVCVEGACPLDLELDEIDLSEKPSGHYTLNVVATDAAGNATSRSRAIYLDSAPPEVELSGSLAESAGQPLPSSSATLDITATEADSASVGLERINVERDGQIVATHLADCAGNCDELETSYVYRAADDGADRQIQQVAESSESSVGGLASVSCAASDDCWATGRTMPTAAEQEEGKSQAPLLEHWDGAEWQATTVPKPAEANDVVLEHVACKSTSFCRAVGFFDNGSANRPLVELWNGTAWSALATPVPFGAAGASGEEISCGAATLSGCWLAGRTEITPAEQAEGKAPTSYLQRWTGTAWATVATPKPPGAAAVFVQGIECASSTSCQAVGHAVTGEVQIPIAASWDGTQWSVDELPLPDGVSGGSLGSVSCPDVEACWASGMSQPTSAETAEGVVPMPFLERWDGSDWTALPAPKVPDSVAVKVSSVSCGSVSACTAVGSYENIYSETRPLAYTWSEDEWRYQPMPTRPEAVVGLLEGVSCTAANECAMVGFTEAESGERTVLAETEEPGQGPHTVTVEAVDAQGNSESKSIEVDVPAKVVDTPECEPEATTVEAKGVLSPGEATKAVEESLPEAVAPSEEMIQETTEVEVDPSYSAPQPDLETEDSLVEGETSVDPEAGFAIGDVACVTPAETTTAATDATVVNEDTALFANTAPETDTVVRPTAGGTTVVQNLRGPDAPDSFSWKIEVSSGQELVELPSGSVAIVEEPSEGEIESALELPEPEAAETPEVLNDADLQLQTAEHELTKAQSETTQEVVAVIPNPWVILSKTVTVPAKIAVAPVEYIPLVWELEITLPLEVIEEQVWPVGLAFEFLSFLSVNGHCARKHGSPCGQPDLGRAARYAVYWGNEGNKGARNNKYADYESNDCTNFISQILRAGGMKFMNFPVENDASWWAHLFVPYFGPPKYVDTDNWTLADKLPRHLWRFGLARLDPVQQPWGWTKGTIVATDWFSTNGKGDINHVFFVVGQRHYPNGHREPLLANHSTVSYPAMPWKEVRRRIKDQHGQEWTRFAVVFKHTNANPAKKWHAPENLYGPGGVFGG